mgnify:FL=1
MTVRISKPAFNLRDKLTELDFARVPYEKMPPQSIIQRKRYFVTSNKSSSSASDLDVITGQIRPIFSSSQILIEIAVTPYGGNTDNLSARGRIRRGYGVANGSSGTQIMYNRRMFFRSGSAQKAMCGQMVAMDEPHTTDILEYVFQTSVETQVSSTIEFYADGYSVGAPENVMTIMEIRGNS